MLIHLDGKEQDCRRFVNEITDIISGSINQFVSSDQIVLEVLNNKRKHSKLMHSSKVEADVKSHLHKQQLQMLKI
jgi:hypothetical protein